MADKLIPPWKNRPTPLQPLRSIALPYPPRGNGGSFPSLPRQMTFEFLETRGVVENGRRPRRAGIKGRFYLSISPFGREFARIRDFEILRRGFSPSSRYPPSSRFKNPTLPSFSLAPISLIFRLVGKGCPNGRIILFLGSWVFGAEDWTNRVRDTLTKGVIVETWVFFFFSFVVLPSSFLFSRGIQESMEMLCNPMLDSIYCGDLSWHDEFHSQLSTYNFPLLRFNLYFRIIIRIHEWWI